MTPPNYDAFGYALGMRVMQSSLYNELDGREKAECDQLVLQRTAPAAPPAQAAPVAPTPVPAGWVREWEGDDSDLGQTLFVAHADERDEPLDRWQPVVYAPTQDSPQEALNARRWQFFVQQTVGQGDSAGEPNNVSLEWTPSGYNGGTWCRAELCWQAPKWSKQGAAEMNAAIDSAIASSPVPKGET